MTRGTPAQCSACGGTKGGTHIKNLGRQQHRPNTDALWCTGPTCGGMPRSCISRQFQWTNGQAHQHMAPQAVEQAGLRQDGLAWWARCDLERSQNDPQHLGSHMQPAWGSDSPGQWSKTMREWGSIKEACMPPNLVDWAIEPLETFLVNPCSYHTGTVAQAQLPPLSNTAPDIPEQWYAPDQQSRAPWEWCAVRSAHALLCLWDQPMATSRTPAPTLCRLHALKETAKSSVLFLAHHLWVLTCHWSYFHSNLLTTVAAIQAACCCYIRKTKYLLYSAFSAFFTCGK